MPVVGYVCISLQFFCAHSVLLFWPSLYDAAASLALVTNGLPASFQHKEHRFAVLWHVCCCFWSTWIYVLGRLVDIDLGRKSLGQQKAKPHLFLSKICWIREIAAVYRKCSKNFCIGREPYLRDSFAKQSETSLPPPPPPKKVIVGLHSDICRPISFKLDDVKTTELCILIQDWMTLNFIQSHSCMKK